MQRRLLFALVAAGVALAGCAQDGTTPDGGSDNGGGTPPAAVSNEQAAALFADAADNIPEKFGMKMTATRSGLSLMTADATFDNTTQTSFFKLQMDESLAQSMGEGATMMGGSADMFQQMSVYTSPQGNAFLLDDMVVLSAPDNAMFDQAAEGEEGFGALMDPEGLVGDFEDDGFTVKSVTPTTLRGKGALKIEATVQDEEAGTQNVTVWLFQDPTRIARIEATTPVMPAEEGEEPDPFSGATMQFDMLYDNEVTLTVPTELQRALGLRYESNRNPFDFGGSGDQGPEVWTFQADGGIAVSEIVAEVGDMDAAAPEWTMPLADGTKSEGGITLTFADVDGDGKVSQGDTLTIDRGEDQNPTQVALRDTVTGLKVVPGFGALLAGLAVLGAALLARRK